WKTGELIEICGGTADLKPGLGLRRSYEPTDATTGCGKMVLPYAIALAAMAAALCALMACAWVVQQRTGNSGWVDTIWTFSVGLVGVSGALWPVAGASPNARQWLVAGLVAI